MLMSGERPEEDPFGGHPSDFECACAITPERTYRLAIIEGSVSLMCDACDKSVPYADWWGEEGIEMEPIAVRLTVHVENSATDGAYAWVEATPVDGVEAT